VPHCKTWFSKLLSSFLGRVVNPGINNMPTGGRGRTAFIIKQRGQGNYLKRGLILPVALLLMLEAKREPCDGVEQNRGENLDVSYK
jgi:hypothetical protein